METGLTRFVIIEAAIVLWSTHSVSKIRVVLIVHVLFEYAFYDMASNLSLIAEELQSSLFFGRKWTSINFLGLLY